MENKVLTIAISGATGFIGTHLTDYFQKKGYKVIKLTRELFKPIHEDQLKEIISQSQIVINLAGASINHRWSEKYKKELYESRIIPTQAIVKAMKESSTPPQLLISTSAIGYYPSVGCYEESTQEMGDTFLAHLCKKWEEEALKATSYCRTVITRFGVVLSPDSEAFRKMVMSTKAKFTFDFAPGTQSFSWIDLIDLQEAMAFIINNKTIQGVVNLVAPEQLSYTDFSHEIADHYKTIATIKIPSFAIQLVMGEAAEFITQTPCAIPKRLLENGFVFQTPTIRNFLQQIK